MADKVEVCTRSYRHGSHGFRWVCKGGIHYTIEPISMPEAGTQVVLHLIDSSLVLLDDVCLTQAIKKYADFISIPIYLDGIQVNSCIPPWTRESTWTNYADYIKARYNFYPLAILPFHFSEPLPADGLLFVPMPPLGMTRDYGEVDIYISRMFVKANDKSLLPSRARFIKGVVNSSSLMPTVSRDEIVRDGNHSTFSNKLGRYSNLAGIYVMIGDTGRAFDYYHKSLAILERIGDHHNAGNTHPIQHMQSAGDKRQR